MEPVVIVFTAIFLLFGDYVHSSSECMKSQGSSSPCVYAPDDYYAHKSVLSVLSNRIFFSLFFVCLFPSSNKSLSRPVAVMFVVSAWTHTTHCTYLQSGQVGKKNSLKSVYCETEAIYRLYVA